MTTNKQYLTREQLASVTSVTLFLNMGGGTYASGVDITDWLRDANVDVSEGVVDTSGDTSGQLIDKIDLIFDNTRGDFDEGGRFFIGGFINNSKMQVVAAYAETALNDDGLPYVVDTLSPYTFNGVIKSDSSAWIISGPDRQFSMGVLQAANILASEIVNIGPSYYNSEGVLTPTYLVPGGSMADTVYQILQQPSIAAVINTGDINLGFDIDGCVDTPAEIVNKKAIDIINQIGMLSNSKWYIDENSTFIFEPIANTGTSAWDINALDDVVSLDDFSFNVLQFDSVTWDDGTLAVQNVQMDYATRQKYSYDIFDKKFDMKWIANPTNRLALLNSFLLQNQFQHHQLTFTCKANPELRFNQLITINLPQQTADTGNNFIWGESSWGDGSLWGPGLPGFKIPSSILWRILTISRKLNLAPDMQIVCVQAGQGSDSAF